jgi:6-phosphofructokinase 1
LIYLPERAFSMDRFVKDVKAMMKRHGRCVVAVSEGITDRAGTPIIAAYTQEVDSHGNVQLSGTGALGDLLAKVLKEQAGIKRVRADTFGYLQRSFPGIASETDSQEAHQVGIAAVKAAVEDQIASGSIAIKRRKTKAYKVDFVVVPLRSVARETRHMPTAFINKAGNDVTQAFVDYARPLVGPLPVCTRFAQLRA